ncbi:MAG: hypothetical protein GX596_14475 [Propionibacterium sp.]|nr:hypothetical protein [Propionibacterium sp.]
MNELRDDFLREVPEEPSTHGWADAVRTKRRRRRAAGSAVAVAVVAAVAVPLGVSLMGRTGEPIVPAEPAPTSPAPVAWPDATHEEMCAFASGPDPIPAEAWVAVDELPEEPARVWLCDTAQAGEQPIVFPQEPLVDEHLVAAAIGTFNELLPLAPDAMCTMEFGMVYTVLYEYADGTVVPVQGEGHGCYVVRTGSDDDPQQRTGAGELLDELTRSWAEQRAAIGEGQGPLGEEACKLGPSLVAADDDRLVGGYACDAAYMAEGSTVEVPGDVVERLIGVERDLVDGGLGEPLMRIAVVDDLGGSRIFWYDGEYVMDEGDWETYGAVPDDLRADLEPIVDATR